MSTPSGLNHTHNTQIIIILMPQIIFFISLRNKLLTMELTLLYALHHPLGMTFIKGAPLKKS